MLVVSRKRDERIIIGGGISITVVEVGGGRVRLGIIAPKEVEIHREEVWVQLHPKSVSEHKEES